MDWLQHLSYLVTLSTGLLGLGILDYRYKLALFYDRQAALKTIGFGTAFFVVWDLIGIHLNIFFTPGSPYILGLMLRPNFPIEEILFLILLCYNTLLLVRGGERLWPRT